MSRPLRSRHLLVGLVFVLVLASIPGGAVEEIVTGRPTIDVLVPENRAAPGERVQLELYVDNTGEIVNGGPAEFEERVTTARGLTLRLQTGDAPLEVETGTRVVGSVPPGAAGPFPFTVVVDEDAPPGRYRLPVTVRYRHTRFVRYLDVEDPRYIDRTVTDTEYVTLVVEERADFEVTGIDSRAQVGDRGTLRVELRHVGTAVARDAVVVLESTDPELAFGAGANRTEAFVGTWEPGEAVDAEFDVRFNEDAAVRNYALVATVRYRDPDGLGRTSDDLVVGLRPLPEQRFTVRDVTGDLRIGEEGTVRGRVVNEGPFAVGDAVVTVRSQSPTLRPVDDEYPLGALEPNGSAPFRFQVDVSNRSVLGPHAITFTTRYREADGRLQTGDPTDVTVRVEPRVRRFVVEPVGATFDVDSDSVLTLAVTNAGDGTVRNLDARLVTADPFSSDDPEAFVAELAPGETERFRFALSVSDDAIPKNGSVAVRFTYETEAGAVETTDPYRIPVTVREQPAAFPVLQVLAGLVVAVIAGWWWVRRM
jgi:hypothetical protein